MTMPTMFDHGVDVTKAHASESVAAYRAHEQIAMPPREVFLLWADRAVLGVYATEEKAEEILRLLPESVPAWIDRRRVG